MTSPPSRTVSGPIPRVWTIQTLPLTSVCSARYSSDVTQARAPKAERQGAGSREQLLDAAERLMAAKGYAATPVSAICKAAGVPVTSLYWHFGNKDGLLATLMERGAERWFAALPRWEDFDGSEQHAEALQTRGADAVAANPDFLRVFYTLAIEGHNDELTTQIVQRVRAHALSYFRSAIEHVLAPLCDNDTARAAADDLAHFAVAFSDGCFFALHLEPDTTDLRQMYADLFTAIRALAPTAISRAASAVKPSQE